MVHHALIRSESVAELGRDVCWLVCFVAAREDMLRYGRVPKFWNPQLMEEAGFTNKKKFLETRRKAVEAGWLIMNGGAKGIEGEYFTAIPERCSSAVANQQELSNEDRSAKSDRQTAISGAHLGSDSHHHSTSWYGSAPHAAPQKAPHPIPSYLITQEHNINDFLDWFQCYPRKVAKSKARDAYASAVKQISSRHESTQQATKWLLEVTQRFADSIKGNVGEFTPYPATWLNQARYDDDQADWLPRSKQASRSNASSEGISDSWVSVQGIVKRVWSPDQKNHQEVMQALGDDVLYAAVKSLGFTAVADWNTYDKSLPHKFTEYLSKDSQSRSVT